MFDFKIFSPASHRGKLVTWSEIAINGGEFCYFMIFMLNENLSYFKTQII